MCWIDNKCQYILYNIFKWRLNNIYDKFFFQHFAAACEPVDKEKIKKSTLEHRHTYINQFK